MKKIKQTLSLIKTFIDMIVYMIKTVINIFKMLCPKSLKDWSMSLNLIFINYFLFTLFVLPVCLAEGDRLLSEFFIPAVTKIEVIEKEIIVKKELTDEDVWVANRLVQAGLNVKEGFVIQVNESGYSNSDNKVGLNSTTVDLGRWQINSQHYGREWKHWLTGETNKLTLACVADYRCSTDWSISKRLHDGNWCAWYGSRKAGIDYCG